MSWMAEISKSAWKLFRERVPQWQERYGYNVFLTGEADGEERDYAIAISEKQQEKFRFHIGDGIKGIGWIRKYPEWEYADYYRIGALKKLKEILYEA